MKFLLTILTASSAAVPLLIGTPALADSQKEKSGNSQAAQQSGTSMPGGAPIVTRPVEVRDLYRNGWLASRLIDKEVVGRKGDDIGEIHDIVVGKDGNIRSVIIEGGGVLDISDTHFAVPWKSVQISNNFDRVQVPVAEDNLDEYGLFGRRGSGGENDFVPTPKGRRIDTIIGSVVTLKDGTGYGIVEDVAFNRNGQILAVIAEPTYGYAGPYAFPYDERWYDGPYGYYGLPYDRDDLGSFDRVEYGEFNGGLTPIASAD